MQTCEKVISETNRLHCLYLYLLFVNQRSASKCMYMYFFIGIDCIVAHLYLHVVEFNGYYRHDLNIGALIKQFVSQFTKFSNFIGRPTTFSVSLKKHNLLVNV